MKSKGEIRQRLKHLIAREAYLHLKGEFFMPADIAE